VRRAGRALLCAAALGSGALLAAHTDFARLSTAQASFAPSAPVEVAPPARERRASLGPLTPRGRRPSAVPSPLDHDPVHPDPFGSAYANGRIITGESAHRILLFTFDDGPNRRTTPKLLDYLDAYGVRGVFFLTASRIAGDTVRQREQQEIAREIVRRGHMLASHTLDHVQLPTLDDAGVAMQIDETARIFEEVVGDRPWLLRPPGGSRSVRVDNMIARRGYTSVLWNLGTGDIQVATKEDVFETWKKVLDRRATEFGDRGGIVLLHDIHEHSVEAFPLIIEEIRRRNCALLEAGEELYDIVDDPRYFFEPRGDGTPSDLAGRAEVPERELSERQARLREETRQMCEG
jgi:peptidoglycan/xylan/chitin deacetylase (PgdA/CDA1 family)